MNQIERFSFVFCLLLATSVGCRSHETAHKHLQLIADGPVSYPSESDQNEMPFVRLPSPAHLVSTSQMVDDQQVGSIVMDATTADRSIEQLVQRGLANHPSIHEARLRIEALRHRAPQALSLPDPMLNTATYLAPVQTAAGEQAFALGVSQKYVNFDRRATAARMAVEEVRQAESKLVQIEHEIAEKIRSTSFQLLFLRQAIRITGEDLEMLGQIAAVIIRQFEVRPSISQQDVLNIQVEQSKIENQLTELRQKETSQLGRLARLVGAAPGEAFAINTALTFQANQLDLHALTAQAIAARPELSGQLASQRRARQRIRLAQLQRKPDFTVGLNWIATSQDGISPVANGDDSVLLGVGFNLPVRKARITAAICEAKASTAAAAYRYQSLRDEIAEEIFDLIAKAESTQEMLGLLQDDIIPNSQRTLDLSIEAFTNDKVSFIELIEDFRALLKFRLAEARTIASYNQTIASLTRSIGQVNYLGDNGLNTPPNSTVAPGPADYFHEASPTGSASDSATR